MAEECGHCGGEGVVTRYPLKHRHIYTLENQSYHDENNLKNSQAQKTSGPIQPTRNSTEN